MSETLSQIDKLKNALIEKGELNGLEIINDLKILNYRGRICDLRKRGISIRTEMKKPKKGNVEIAHYSIISSQLNLLN